MAAERSNCPSAENGGALGQMQRGETVPEFEAALWRIAPGTIADSLIETRYGLHIIRVNRRHEGQQLPFEQVQEGIAQALTAASRDAAWRQYVQVLLGRAKIEGIDLEGADTISLTMMMAAFPLARKMSNRLHLHRMLYYLVQPLVNRKIVVMVI